MAKSISKVVYNGTVLIDLTADTITASDLAYGVTAHGANGELITGTMKVTDTYSFTAANWSGSASAGYTLTVGKTGAPFGVFKLDSATSTYSSVADTAFYINGTTVTLKSPFAYDGKVDLIVAN